MKTKNISRMMLAMFCATLMIMMIPLNVYAVSNIITVDFETSEGGSSGQDFPAGGYSSIINTFQQGGTTHSESFKVSTLKYKTGTKSMQLSAGTSGYTVRGLFNLSYSVSDFLTSISFWIYSPGEYTPYSSRHTITIYFFNSSLNSNCWIPTNNALVYSYTSGTASAGWTMGGHGMDEYGNAGAIGCWHFLNVTVLNELGDVGYYDKSTYDSDFVYFEGVMSNTTYALNDIRIDRVLFSHYGGSPYNSDTIPYIDTVNLTVADAYGGITSGCSDFTGSTPTGRFAYGSTDVDSSHISTRYNVPVTTTITGVELQIMQTQYDNDHTISNYECSLNGISLGNPVCIFAESYYYVIQWTCSASVTAQTINFDFYHSQLMSGTQYWEVGCGVSNSDDVNGDGEVGFVFTDNSVVYHWEWILGIPFFVPTYGAGDTTFPRDLGMRFWSTGFTATETFDYDDGLGLSHYWSSNSTGYIYNMSAGFDNVMGTYTLGNSGASYTLNLYVNGTRSYDYGFPISCRYPGDGFGFSPNTIGEYRLQLNSTHAVANVTAWVIGTRSGYSIRTNPVISNQFMSYSVIANYNNPQGYSGGIAMDNYVETLNTFLQCMYQRHPVTNNQTTTFSYQSNGTLPEYWGLYVYANNLYTKVDDCKHYIRLPSVYTNDIHTPNNNYVVSTEGVSSLGVTLIGTHMFPGGDVRIYANSIYVMNVGDSQYFTETFYPRAFGYYNITMLLYQNGTFTYLANCNFTVSNSDSPETEDPNQQYADLIPDEYKLFVAIGIILGFMFMPMAFIYSMNKTMQRFNVTVNVPAMVIVIMSVMTGIVGYTLTIMWGMLEWWTIFLLIFVLALVVLILYLKGGKTE